VLSSAITLDCTVLQDSPSAEFGPPSDLFLFFKQSLFFGGREEGVEQKTVKTPENLLKVIFIYNICFKVFPRIIARYILNINIYTTCYIFKDFPELQFI
jgi:hypothetical protein